MECHCWKDYRDWLEADGQNGTDEWLGTFDDSKTCMAMDGHDGPHEWISDSDISVSMKEPNDYMVECCNEGCGWTGLKSKTVVFKRDKGKPNVPLFCPECHEVCEPIDFDL